MAYSEAGDWQNWPSGLCLALWSVGDWQDGTFQLQVGGRAPSHRLSCLTLPVSTWLTSFFGHVWFGHPAGSWHIWRELLLSPSCFSLGKHICWRHLSSPGSLSESQCRCPRLCARTAKNQQVLGLARQLRLPAQLLGFPLGWVCWIGDCLCNVSGLLTHVLCPESCG